MSITDELREYVQDWRDTPSLMDDLDRGDIDGILEDFIRIADRIDAEHEKAVTAARSNGITKYGSMVAREYVKLPVDVDGVPIHVGDTVEEVGEDPTRYTVCGVGTLQDRPAVFYGNPSKYGYADGWDFAENVCHVQPDTWERIIGDALTIGWQNGNWNEVASEETHDKLVERCRILAGEA